jgi:hypothetical protein
VAGMFVLFGWLTRRRYDSFGQPAWPVESAILLVLTVLLSPITWEQHLVLMIPALYLITAQAVEATSVDRGLIVSMIVFVLLSLILTRDLLGKDDYAVLLSYHIQTLCMLIVLGVALTRRSAWSISG